jgi:hypothetical protein
MTGTRAEAIKKRQRDHEKLAAWAAIIAVPTAVTGLYGQNILYPGVLGASGPGVLGLGGVRFAGSPRRGLDRRYLAWRSRCLAGEANPW